MPKARTPAPTSLADLRPDPVNRRAHPARNLAMTVEALRAVGAARSIVIDEDNLILAGNGVTTAAAEAGITKLRVVDVDGQTLVAVRRRGLSPADKRALALYDNRTGELAEWNITQLTADLTNGEDLTAFFLPDELERLTGMFDVAGADAPLLSAADRPHFQQMTFTLHDDQVETVKIALARARDAGGATSPDNENANGNALAFIAARYLTNG
jgi:ParB-like chromosome segregation protein Spo0J